MSIIAVRDLLKNYDGFTALGGINFTVREGEIFGFLGPNGAGKTTTINILTGLARLSGGSVSLFGRDYTGFVEKAQGQIGVVPDESNLYDELTGIENLSFCAALYGMNKKEREDRAKNLLEEFGLTEAGTKLFKKYSRGMKRRLTIAAGIIHRPRILFLDEPTTGIDVMSARHVRKMIARMNKEGTTIFLTTHYIEEAERLCDRIAFIVAGRVVRIGATNDLIAQSSEGWSLQVTLASSWDRENWQHKLKGEMERTLPGLKLTEIEETTLHLYAETSHTLLPVVEFFARHNLDVLEARVLKPSLEEVFVKATGLDSAVLKQGEGGRR